MFNKKLKKRIEEVAGQFTIFRDLYFRKIEDAIKAIQGKIKDGNDKIYKVIDETEIAQTKVNSNIVGSLENHRLLIERNESFLKAIKIDLEQNIKEVGDVYDRLADKVSRKDFEDELKSIREITTNRIDSIENLLVESESKFSKQIDNISKEINLFKDTMSSFFKSIDHLEKGLKYRMDDVEKAVHERINVALVDTLKIITAKHMESFENIFKWNKQASLINRVAQSFDDKGLEKLKQEMILPFVKEQYKKENEIKAGKIEGSVKTLGQKISDRRRELYEKRLKVEKSDQPGKETEIKEINSALAEIDWIISGGNNGKKD